MRDGIPYIRSLKGDSDSRTEDGQMKQAQIILNITKDQWTKLAATLELTKPVIELSNEQ